MIDRENYVPGNAYGAQVLKDGKNWTLILTRDLHHAPEKVWDALTDPVHLREWAPFDSDQNLSTPGTRANLTNIGSPKPLVSETTVTKAEYARELEYDWGGRAIRWELKPIDIGTRLTLWHNIDRGFISMGAAGWHICFDVLDSLLNGESIGRIVGSEAMKFEWRRLNEEYAKQFGVEKPNWSPPESG